MLSFLLKKKIFSYILLDAGWGRLAIGSFHPSGEPISPHRSLITGAGWVGPFAVVYYSSMGFFFVAAAILARE
jgi:hypothetical protein